MKYNVRFGGLREYKFEVELFGHEGNVFAWMLSAETYMEDEDRHRCMVFGAPLFKQMGRTSY
jgi:hypothetical protein